MPKIAEINEHGIPPNGWIFRQPETKWVTPTPISSTLDQTVQLIIAMRKKNVAITAKHKLATNKEAVKAEVLRFTRKRLGLPEEATPTPFRVSHRYPGSAGAGAVADRISGGVQNLKRAAEGTSIILEWLGSGANPVEQELSEKRAAICVACPKNVQGSWFTEAPAELIKRAVETWKTITGKKEFEFKTTQDGQLKSCDVCKCLLPLKVHAPLEHILNKTKPEIMAEFPKNCWIARKDA